MFRLTADGLGRVELPLEELTQLLHIHARLVEGQDVLRLRGVLIPGDHGGVLKRVVLEVPEVSGGRHLVRFQSQAKLPTHIC